MNKKIWSISFISVTLITVIAFWFTRFSSDDEDFCPSDSNVAVVKIRGEIVAYPYASDKEAVTDADTLIAKIRALPDVQALILDIDSPGGDAAASEAIMNAVWQHGKDTVAIIGSQGDSGGYLIASVADKIFAREFSEVGSIGITSSYLDQSEKNSKNGVAYQEITSGQYKDVGIPNRPLSTQEKAYLLRQAKKGGEIFAELVAKNRNLDIQKVKAIADGSTFWGKEAIEKDLVDDIGGMEEALDWIKENKKISPKICTID